MGRDAPVLAARNPDVHALRRLLRRRSARSEADRFVIEGPRLVLEALDAGVAVDAVYVPVDAAGAEVDELRRRGQHGRVVLRDLAPGVIDGLGTTVNPQPALAVAQPRHRDLATALHAHTAPLVVVLCDVADPGNAGTLVRVAEAAGAACVVVCGPAGVDVYNPKVVRAAAGSLFRVPVVIVPDPAVLLDGLAVRGIPTAGAVVAGGQPYDHAALGGAVALVLGNEAHGLDPAVAARLQLRLTIPMQGAVESLNVAVAGAVLAFEAARQRRAARP